MLIKASILNGPETANKSSIWTPDPSMGQCPPIDQALIDYLKVRYPLKLRRDQDIRDYDALRGP